MYHKWTKQEINRLLALAETKSRHEIAEAMGLHWKTIANRLAAMGVRPRTEMLSLSECIRRTGYLKHQLRRAKEAIGQPWKRRYRRGQAVGITEDQLDALCEYLKTEGSKPPL